MGSVIGIPTTRVSDLFIRQRLSNQVQSDQLDLFRIQMQLSTGRRFQLPSEDSDAAQRAMSLQRLLERKDQVRNNMTTNQSFLSATDAALTSVSGAVAEIRATALGVVGATASDTQRAAAAQQVRQMIGQLQDVGNQKFRGRYLFAGSGTTVMPFETSTSGHILYAGDEGRLSSYADIDLLFETNLDGNEVFGAISRKVEGTQDLNPVLIYNTRLADLRGRRGITPGSIAITAGNETSTIDISDAETIGDVAALIRANPPSNDALNVEITPTGLWIELIASPGELLTIREVGGGTTAAELGILTETGVSAPVQGKNLDPVLRLTTRIDEILGVRARAVARSNPFDSDVIFEAPTVGGSLNGIGIVFDDDGSVAMPGSETASYDGATKTLTVKIIAGATEARHVVDAVNAAYAAGDVPLQARLDPLDDKYGGRGLVNETPLGEFAGTTQYGSGTPLDKGSGLQIVNDGQTHVVDFASAVTVEDALNALNMSGAGVLAEISEDGTAINLRSRVSGTDFMIGENGGTTATQLGLRSFTEQTRLDDLNFGRGIADHEGTDFTITITATAANPIEIDVSGLETIEEVIDLINSKDPANLLARPAQYGNGIELVDLSEGTNTLVVTRMIMSNAAADLGLIVQGQETSAAAVAEDAAAVTLTSAAPQSDLIFTARNAGTEYNAVQVVFDPLAPPGAVYDGALKTLTFGITAGVTTANDIIAALAISPADALFEATLDPSDGSPNTGIGAVDPGTSAGMSGGSLVFKGADPNPQETEGAFTALLRLENALVNDDQAEIERALALLDQSMVQLNFSRAGLGARQQGLDVMQMRLDEEEIDLRTTLSLEIDVDFVEALSAFSGRQIAMEASLRTAAQLLQFSLLNFI